MNGPQITMFARLTDDPEQRYTKADGTPYTRIRVACNRYLGPEREAETYFFDVNLWRGNGENAMNNCRKGDEVFISGNYYHDEYERRDGSRAIAQQVNANDFHRHHPTRREREAAIAAAQNEAAPQEKGNDSAENPEEF